jgi:hypothetical protein
LPNWFLGFPVPRAKFAEVAAQAASAVALPFTDLYYHTFFESLDSFVISTDTGGSVSSLPSGVELRSDGTLNAMAQFYVLKSYLPVMPTWDKPKTIIARPVFFEGLGTSPQFWIGAGWLTNAGLFFFLDQLALKVISRLDPSNATTLALANYSSVSAFFAASLKIVFTPGVSAEFYVDNVLEATITTNLPVGSSLASRLLHAKIFSSVNLAEGYLAIYEFHHHQEA